MVLPEQDAAEVERKAAVYEVKLNAVAEVDRDLARRAALNAVRMDRAADQQAALAEHIRRVEADFVAPEGVTGEEAAHLRAEAVRRAMFDPSKEAYLASKYESAAERSYFRCLKEPRERERAERAAARADARDEAEELLGSSLRRQEAIRKSDEEMDAWYAARGMPLPELPPLPSYLTPSVAGIDLPIGAGKSR